MILFKKWRVIFGNQNDSDVGRTELNIWSTFQPLFSIHCNIVNMCWICNINSIRFVLTSRWLYEGSCPINILCVYVRIVVSITYCIVYFFVCLRLGYQYLWIVNCGLSLMFSLTFMFTLQQYRTNMCVP
jgi:hypothetical protein